MKKVLLTALIGASLFASQAQAAIVNTNVGVSYDLDTLGSSNIGFITSTSNAQLFELVTTTTVYLTFKQLLNASEFTLYTDTSGTLNNVIFDDTAGTPFALTTPNSTTLVLTTGQYVLKLNPSAAFGVTVANIPVPAAAWLFGSALFGAGVFRRKQLATV